MKTAAELRQLVTRIDHRSYPAYKDTKGMYQFPGYLLSIDHVQGDPFASPSRVSIQVKGKIAGFPEQLYQTKWQKTALEDALIRQFGQCCEKFGFKAKGSGKSGMISISRCGQEVLERSAAQIDEKTGDIHIRLEVGFPANGRTINAREWIRIFFEFLPECVEKALYYKNCDAKRLQKISDLAEEPAGTSGHTAKAGIVCFCCKRIYSAARVRRFRPSDEKRSLFPVSRGDGSGNYAAAQRCDKRNGNSKRDHSDRGRWIPWKVHSFEGVGAWRVQSYCR